MQRSALEELAVLRGRRHAALVQPGLHDLAGLGDAPDHRRVAPLAPAGAPCSLLLRMNHRGIDVQGHPVPALQGRLQHPATTSCRTSRDRLLLPTRYSQLPSVAAHDSDRNPVSPASVAGTMRPDR